MSAFRCPRDCGTSRKDYQPYTLIDMLRDADEDLGSGRPVSVSSLEISSSASGRGPAVRPASPR